MNASQSDEEMQIYLIVRDGLNLHKTIRLGPDDFIPDVVVCGGLAFSRLGGQADQLVYAQAEAINFDAEAINFDSAAKEHRQECEK